MPFAPKRFDRGVTLLELMVSTTIAIIVAAMATTVSIRVQADAISRREVSAMQSDARDLLQTLARDLRASCPGMSKGLVVSAKAGNAVALPCVQVYDAVGSGGVLASILDPSGNPGGLAAKANTDALVVVGRDTTAGVTVLTQAVYNTSGAYRVTNNPGFLANDLVCLADNGSGYLVNLSWVLPTWLIGYATGWVNTAPASGIQTSSLIFRARSRLYYVNVNDQLIQMELNAPHPPATPNEVRSWMNLGASWTNTAIPQRGTVENLQLRVGMMDSPSRPPGGSGDPNVTADAIAAFGSGTPLINPSEGDTSQMATVSVFLQSHTLRELPISSTGTPPIAVEGVIAEAPEDDDGDGVDRFERRVYSLTIGLRNLSPYY